MSQRVVFCADDYALSPGVSRGIIDLIERGRISATGCMTVSPYWAESAQALRPMAGRVDVGLHFTLTDHKPLGPLPGLAPDGRLPSLAVLLARAFTGRLDAREINAELARQVAAFMGVFGAPPAFIDGHQHVHLLPVVRQAVVAAAQALPGCRVRDCHEPPGYAIARGVATAKTVFIGQLGRGLRGLVARHGLPANRGFRGIYDLTPRVPFAELMARFLAPPFEAVAGTAEALPLVMVHPGFPDAVLRRIDSVTDQRRVEYDYLQSDQFADLLNVGNLVVSRWGGAS